MCGYSYTARTSVAVLALLELEGMFNDIVEVLLLLTIVTDRDGREHRGDAE